MPLLITVSGKHIDLPSDSSLTLGRESQCDVVVEDCSCSRLHAVLTVNTTSDTCYVEDLNSRNGTFLNGKKIVERTRVPDGSHILVGSTLFVVSHEEVTYSTNETREMYSSETLFLEGPMSKTATSPVKKFTDSGIAGRLASISFVEALQLLTLAGRSGTLYLDLKKGLGSVEVRSGEVLAARYGNESGIEAIQAMTINQDGRFRFEEHNGSCELKIQLPTQQLLLEICRLIDESTNIEANFEDVEIDRPVE